MTTPHDHSHYHIVLVGCGKMGQAMLNGWLAQGVDAARVLVVDPFAKGLPAGVQTLTEASAIPAGATADVVVVAVKPQVLADAIAPYRQFAASGAVFLSVAAGKTIAGFHALLGAEAKIVRAMPNTPAAVGRGMTVLCAGAGVSEAEKARCQTLAQAVGVAAWLEDEALMDAVTAISGSGPAYIFHLTEALEQAARALGLPEELSAVLARQTVAGAGELLAQASESPEQLRKNVTSPGGTTAAALEVLMNPETGLPPLMVRATAAAERRGRELA